MLQVHLSIIKQVKILLAEHIVNKGKYKRLQRVDVSYISEVLNVLLNIHGYSIT